jgi:hypothetical protein
MGVVDRISILAPEKSSKTLQDSGVLTRITSRRLNKGFEVDGVDATLTERWAGIRNRNGDSHLA